METEISIEQQKSFSNQIQKKSAIYRAFLKLRSVISKKDIISLYNNDMLENAAKIINKDKGPVVNYKNKQIDYGFYQKFVTLKEVASFFSKYLNLSDEEMGEYYVILVSIATPSFALQTNQITDPCNLSQNDIDNIKARDKLIEVLDDCLKTMSDDVRSTLYQSVFQTLWLVNFIKLPFEQIIALFQKTNNNVYTCPFSISFDILNDFFPILLSKKEFSITMFEALFEFSAKKGRIRSNLGKDAAKKQFVDKCVELTNYINDFYTNNEILLLSKIVNNEISYIPEEFSFNDNWIDNLQTCWSKDILKRWAEWVQEIRKTKLKNLLSTVYNLLDFPLLENRPWTLLNNHIEFSKELTAGLIFWYVQTNYDDTISFLRRIQKEGDFNDFSAKNEWAEGINLFEVSSNQILDISFKLAPSGKFGQVFLEISSGKMQYFRAQTQIENLMNTIETEFQQIIETFIKGCKIIDYCMDGIEISYLSNNKSSNVRLTNFESMGGQQHELWLAKLSEFHKYIKNLVYISTELLLIDGIKTGIVE